MLGQQHKQELEALQKQHTQEVAALRNQMQLVIDHARERAGGAGLGATGQ
jgi:F0F1-type ATP synthase membrane subunit b/b'